MADFLLNYSTSEMMNMTYDSFIASLQKFYSISCATFGIENGCSTAEEVHSNQQLDIAILLM